MFFVGELRPFSHHLSPAFHHKSTIKKPPFTTTFSQKPPQKPGFPSPEKNTQKNNSRTEALPS
jgi:hypothetical protein